MNDLTMTASGWVATEPKLHIGPSGTTLCTFRLATTPRRYDRTANTWVDGDTQWFTVRTFRGAAVTVKQSVKKGQPLVVTGRLRTNTWEANDGPRTDLQIDATSLGHDLTLGIATFNRAVGDPTLGVEDVVADASSEEGEGAVAEDDAAVAGAWDVEPEGDEPEGLEPEGVEPEEDADELVAAR
ncbi:single-stranded DNA-binding protein [Demequina salsinemoris]|uniref:single-stranded DNA-binding protein n=1 Tax=Demequina salsinemoris TaxID=577470 RepID=UPI000784E227|nr:single-stranded DNA-binding protein [Demequina salsinemoris]